MSISERISQIIHTLNIDATEFSKKIGGTPQKVSNWVRGENKPSFETLMYSPKNKTPPRHIRRGGVVLSYLWRFFAPKQMMQPRPNPCRQI
jgi:hypothetical protein